MSHTSLITGVLVDETTTITYVELCRKYPLPEAWLLELFEQGLIEHDAKKIEQVVFDPRTIQKILSAHRLKTDLGVNVPGAVMILELLDKIDAMRQELEILQRFFGEKT